MTALPKTMTAIKVSRPGGPEALVPMDIAVPEPGAGEVLIRVEAAGVNRPDLLQRQGLYPPPPGAPDTPMAPNTLPPASIGRPPPMATTCDIARMPLIGLPAWVSAARSAVGILKLAAVQALRVAVSTVWAPAKRSRNSTCIRPVRSTTATATW